MVQRTALDASAVRGLSLAVTFGFANGTTPRLAWVVELAVLPSAGDCSTSLGQGTSQVHRQDLGLREGLDLLLGGVRAVVVLALVSPGQTLPVAAPGVSGATPVGILVAVPVVAPVS